MLSLLVFGFSTGFSYAGYRNASRKLDFADSASDLSENFTGAKNAYLMTKLKCLRPVIYDNNEYLIKIFKSTPVFKSIVLQNDNAWEDRRNGDTTKTVEKASGILALDDDKITLDFMPLYIKKYKQLLNEMSEYNQNQESNINLNFNVGSMKIQTKNETLEKIVNKVYGIPVDNTYYLILGTGTCDHNGSKTFMENKNLIVVQNKSLEEYKNELCYDMTFYRGFTVLSILGGIVAGTLEISHMLK